MEEGELMNHYRLTLEFIGDWAEARALYDQLTLVTKEQTVWIESKLTNLDKQEVTACTK